ncbi:hypothetical protein V2J09_006719 [Rumex salicifolius]
MAWVVGMDEVVLIEVENCGGSPTTQDACNKSPFSDSCQVEAVGMSGDLWMLWNEDNLKIQIMREGSILSMLSLLLRGRIPPHSYLCSSYSSSEIFFLACAGKWITGPLFVGGDFNTILTLDERQGGSNILFVDSNLFAKWVNYLNLVDLGFSRPPFTWSRGSSSNMRVAKCLDLIFTNLVCRIRWVDASIKHLPEHSSDHKPILLSLKRCDKTQRRRRPFRFEAAWLEHLHFQIFVDRKWDRQMRYISP